MPGQPHGPFADPIWLQDYRIFSVESIEDDGKLRSDLQLINPLHRFNLWSTVYDEYESVCPMFCAQALDCENWPIGTMGNYLMTHHYHSGETEPSELEIVDVML